MAPLRGTMAPLRGAMAPLRGPIPPLKPAENPLGTSLGTSWELYGNLLGTHGNPLGTPWEPPESFLKSFQPQVDSKLVATQVIWPQDFPSWHQDLPRWPLKHACVSINLYVMLLYVIVTYLEGS